MELSKNYDPAKVEDKWYKHWKKKGYFTSAVDERPAFTVVIPPPNVTGVLHMGHTLNETVQDILVRRARMSGYNTCWVPGSDHASIATEAKVVDMLKKEKGIDKSQLTREEFLKYAFEWKEKYGGIIYHQIEKLGCSVDWNRVSFTMDSHYYKAVIKVFVDLFNKKKIYRGARMINWDPSAKTALSDEEVEYKDVQGTLYYVKYLVAEDLESGIQNSDRDAAAENFITIATQRPETIMGDTAVCVHPSDERFKHLKGKHVIVPLVNRKVPVIFDEYVDPEFGTGALKITPAHDINDYNLGLKHNLEIIDTLNEDGTMSEAARVYIGVDRFEARRKIINQLKQEGLLIKEEQYQTRLGFSQRTNAIVEPRISTQWFVAMRSLADMALQEVLEERINIHPGEKFLATYKYWLENVKDWCISRQLWWGQRIPAWYDENGRFVVAETEEEAGKLYVELYGRPSTVDGRLTQDEDVLDTWFSSWLWPIEVFKGISDPGNREIKYYYPTSVLVTGQDIIFFWVARMIMAGMEYMNEKPFSDVYFTGMVRDKLGRKMSKSLGNSPDLLQMIEKSGADAVRFGIMVSSPAGNDLLFDDSSPEQGRNFNNKLWNALKLVRMWNQRQKSTLNSETNDSSSQFAIDWFQNRLSEVRLEVDKLMSSFKLSEALKTIYSLIWDDFCSWYLEWVKPAFEQPIESSVYNKTVYFFEELLQLLHPYMPFVTEEIYHLLKDRDDDLCVKQFKSEGTFDKEIIKKGEDLKLFLTTIREFRKENNLKNSTLLPVEMPSLLFGASESIYKIIKKQLNVETVISNQTTSTTSMTTSTVIPFKNVQIKITTPEELDTSKLKIELLKKLEYQKGFLDAVNKKLANEKFIKNAKPELVALEHKKKKDAEANIKSIEESLASL